MTRLLSYPSARPDTLRRPKAGIVVSCLLAVACATPAAAQPATRKATDIASLEAYPGFYSGEPIVLRADLMQTGNSTVLVQSDEARALRVTSDGPPGPTGRVEARGVFWDVGRLRPDDPRVQTNHLQTIVDPGIENDWPRPGELFAVHVTDAFPIDTPSRPSLRDVVLDAPSYVDKEVTITGQFRGRNLYGDLPQAPGLSRWDFVLKSADGALWVTGTQPRGRGFDLNVGARIDTGRWLEVSGIVRRGRGLVWLDSAKISTVEAPEQVAPVETVVPPTGPAPIVIFSAPTEGERDVPLSGLVRLQFSRDMDPASFIDQVRVEYVASPGLPAAGTAPGIMSAYDPATRSLTVRFTEPLDRLRTVRMELLGGIKATDGALLMPWTLSFELGG
jgi:Bacterial Ig-like domain